MKRRLALLLRHPLDALGAALLACAIAAAAANQIGLAERTFLIGAGLASFTAIQLLVRHLRWLHQPHFGSGPLRATWRVADAVAAAISGGTLTIVAFLGLLSLLVRIALPPDPRHGHAYLIITFGMFVGLPVAVISALAVGVKTWRAFVIPSANARESLPAPAAAFYLVSIGTAAAVCTKLDDPANAAALAAISVLAFTTGMRLWRASSVAVAIGTFTILAMVVLFDMPVGLFLASCTGSALAHATWRLMYRMRRRGSGATAP